MDTSGINRDAIRTNLYSVIVLLIEEEEEDAGDCNDHNESKIACGDIVYSINDLNSKIAIVFELEVILPMVWIHIRNEEWRSNRIRGV